MRASFPMIVALLVIQTTMSAMGRETVSVGGIALQEPCINAMRSKGDPRSVTLVEDGRFRCVWDSVEAVFSRTAKAILVRGSHLRLGRVEVTSGSRLQMLVEKMGPPTVSGPGAAHWKKIGLTVLVNQDDRCEMFILSATTVTATLTPDYLPDIWRFPTLNIDGVFPGLAEKVAKVRCSSDQVQYVVKKGYVVEVYGPHLEAGVQMDDRSTVIVRARSNVSELPPSLHLRRNGDQLSNDAMGLTVLTSKGTVKQIKISMSPSQHMLFKRYLWK